MKILLADKDPDFLDVTTYALRRYGFEVIPFQDGLDVLRGWKECAPDLVLANIDLPGRTGLELCRDIRQHGDTPVIIVGARNSDDEVVQSFQMGADDYVLKPVSHRQLAMRVQAILSRTTRGRDRAAPVAELRSGKLRLDLESHEVTYGTHVVRLTPIEFRILYLLMLSAGRVVSTSRLIEYAWGYNHADPGILKMHVSRIRHKVGLRGAEAPSISSVRWVGYRLHGPSEER
jgi:two-component system, OmpR family, response regulator RegX3